MTVISSTFTTPIFVPKTIARRQSANTRVLLFLTTTVSVLIPLSSHLIIGIVIWPPVPLNFNDVLCPSVLQS